MLAQALQASASSYGPMPCASRVAAQAPLSLERVLSRCQARAGKLHGTQRVCACAAQALGTPAVMRCMLDRSTQLRQAKTSMERLHLLYLVDNTLSVRTRGCCRAPRAAGGASAGSRGHMHTLRRLRPRVLKGVALMRRGLCWQPRPYAYTAAPAPTSAQRRCIDEEGRAPCHLRAHCLARVTWPPSHPHAYD